MHECAGVPARRTTGLLRGGGRFVDDEGGRALHLKLVRSPYAHARIFRWTIKRRRRSKVSCAP